MCPLRCESNADARALRRVLDRIIDEINQGLLDRTTIKLRVNGSGTGLRSVELKDEGDPALGGIRFDDTDGVAQQRGNIRRLKFVFLAALLNARKVQDIPD